MTDRQWTFTLIGATLLCVALIAAMFVVPFRHRADYYDGDADHWYHQSLAADRNRPVEEEELTIFAGSAMSLKGLNVDLYRVGVFNLANLNYGHTITSWETDVVSDEIGRVFLDAMNKPGVCEALDHAYECSDFRTTDDKDRGGNIAYSVFARSFDSQFVDDKAWPTIVEALREEFTAHQVTPTVQGLVADTPSITVNVPQGHYLAIDSSGRVAMGYTLVDGMTSNPDNAGLYDQTFGQLAMSYGDVEQEYDDATDTSAEYCWKDERCNLSLGIWGRTAPPGVVYRVRDSQGRLLEFDRESQTWHAALDEAHATQIRLNSEKTVVIRGLEPGEYDLLQQLPTGYPQGRAIDTHLIVRRDGSISYDTPESEEMQSRNSQYDNEHLRSLYVSASLWSWQREPFKAMGYVLAWGFLAFLAVILVALPVCAFARSRIRKARQRHAADAN